MLEPSDLAAQVKKDARRLSQTLPFSDVLSDKSEPEAFVMTARDPLPAVAGCLAPAAAGDGRASGENARSFLWRVLAA